MKSFLTTLVAVAGLMLGASVANAQPQPRPQPQQPRPVVVLQPVFRPVYVPPVFAPRPYFGTYNTYNYGFNYSYGFNSYGQTFGSYHYGFYQQNRFGFWGW
jgi:hypothetical protein